MKHLWNSKNIFIWINHDDSHRNYLALDLGAESGRTIVGTLDDGKLTLTETIALPTVPCVCLMACIGMCCVCGVISKQALHAAVKESEQNLTSIGLDTWGVDFALLDKNNSLLSNPFHYRDARTDGMLDEAFKRMPRAEIFANTGIQFMQINTLYQLLAMSVQKSPLLDVAKTFVTIPDLFNYWLSGEITNEFTNATTTQCLRPAQTGLGNSRAGRLEHPHASFQARN